VEGQVTLISSNNKNIKKLLGRSMIKIDKNLWIGNLTVREIERLNSAILLEKCVSSKVFSVSKQDYEKYFKIKLAFLFDP
jgi:hypothetical protein